MTDVPRLSVILPVHDQADHIEQLVGDHVARLDGLGITYELLLITNGCRDESPALARALADRHPGVETFDINPGGWGRAVRFGLTQARGEVLCFTNSARTSPETLVLHLAYSLAFPDVVLKANRKIRDNWRRRLGSLLYNLESRALFDLAYWDVNGTPKVFPRHFTALLELSRDDDLIDLEFNAVCRRENYPMIEVPVLSTQRAGGTSTTNYGSALRMYRGALELKRSSK